MKEAAAQAQTTADKLRELTKDLTKIANAYDETVASQTEAEDRLAYIFGGNVALARTVYRYAISGHLSHANYLRERLSRSAESV
jgi:hypothetical protein